MVMLAEYDSPSVLLQAAEKFRDAGYTHFDCHSPFPIHGLNQAMGLKRSSLGYLVGIAAIIGFTAAITLQWWTSAIDYPIVISGKPLFSYQAFVPVTFALAVLFSAITATIGMFVLNRLPRYHHSMKLKQKLCWNLQAAVISNYSRINREEPYAKIANYNNSPDFPDYSGQRLLPRQPLRQTADSSESEHVQSAQV